jgi:hypothetical protein
MSFTQSYCKRVAYLDRALDPSRNFLRRTFSDLDFDQRREKEHGIEGRRSSIEKRPVIKEDTERGRMGSRLGGLGRRLGGGRAALAGTPLQLFLQVGQLCSGRGKPARAKCLRNSKSN